MNEITLSALVVLRPHRLASSRGGSAGRPSSRHPVARESVEAATGFFARLGFSVGDVVGTSFWIKSDPWRFEDLFGQPVEIRRRRDQIEFVRLRDGSTEFDLAPLPDDIARHLLAVIFTEPLISQWVES